MSAQFARAPHQGQTSVQPSPAPHAALLIDFDNVTMGIRSDLTKELKNLLNSAIIKGKVAVQRAYADWRRYPQYIVPLAESSVDLIFAPAYGSAKKNATDIRLAIDALELVFIRPEIGTFILLSGDSDFSSLVLKLKEYGKYVIGVGIRESASDLLVQNCDEYYSYSALTGLTRAGDEAPVASEDPWELVDVAIRQMADNDDVMRSDRLKQVLLELDPNFDEKALGFTKFNKFLQEAASRGVLALRKQENGQFEIAPGDGVPASREDEGEPRSRRRRGGRGRRRDGTDGREERPARTDEPAAAAPAPDPARRAPQPEAPAMQAETAVPAAVEERPAPAARRNARTERAPAPEPAEPEAPKRAVEPTRAEPTRAEPTRTEPVVEPVGNDLDAAYVLLRRATGDLSRGAAQPARDSDVKRRLLELDPQWDESNLGFSKFSRFLRRAHDDEVVTLRKLENGNYEVFAGSVEPIDDDGRSRRGRGRDERGRRGGRGREHEDGVTPAADDAQPARAAAARPGTEPGAPARASKETPAPAPAAKAERPQGAVPEAETAAAARAPRPLGVRRGSRSRGGAPTAPPPLFEGQAAKIGSSKPTAQRSTEPPAVAAEQGRPTAAGAAEPGSWFPSDRDGAIEHLAGYKGVGRKSAEAVVDEFGAGALAGALTDQRDRVLALLGRRRGETLLTAFDAELAERSSAPRAAGDRRPEPRKTSARTAKKRSGAAAKSSKPEKSPEGAGAGAAKKSSRTRRGGARKKPARSS